MTDGRVLVTGGTGAFGVATTKWLTRAGHDVVVFARREPSTLPKGARFCQGDIGDADSVRRGMDGCDVVVHLAWTISGSVNHEEAEPVNIGGTQNVVRAMADTGCGRLVFASSVTAYGAHADHPQPWLEHEKLDPAYGLVYEWHKAQAEAMIAESGVEAVRVRPTVVVGRDAHNAPANVYRQLVVPDFGETAKIQMVHQDDVGRFFAHACDSAAVGAVNLAAHDALTWREVAQLAGRPALPTPPRMLVPAVRALSKVAAIARSAPELFDMFLHWPIADTSRLANEFGFQLAYSSAEAIADQGRNSASHIVVGMKEIRRPMRLDKSYPRDAAQADAAGGFVDVVSGDARGEFDTARADPNYPEWSCANLAEAFPGPMTPLSVELVRDALFTGADQVASLLPLDERTRENVRRRQISIFGHRFYQNVSVLREMASSVPGQTPEDFDHQINGQPYPAGYVRPRVTSRDALAYLKFAGTAGPRLTGIGRAVADVESRARDIIMSRDALREVSDERLRARIDMLWNECVQAWKVGLLCTFLVSGPSALLERRYGISAVGSGTSTAGLASSRLLRGVRDLATTARLHPHAMAVLSGTIDENSWAGLEARDPDFARQVQALLDESGHRGPGETELANPVYADAPWLLLRAVSGMSRANQERVSETARRNFGGRVLAKVTWATILRRERCRDAVMRLTHQLRIALREWGNRLVEKNELVEPADVFYLTRDELFSSPSGRLVTVSRRRTERDRLATIAMPLRFAQPVDLDGSLDMTSRAGQITGVPAAPGVAVGKVRVMSSPEEELEPGEVLVARVTDTGWTPFFGAAAAVVTDIGGSMSHASIVAREFGIPAVVGTENASQVLSSGQLVEVNGTTGNVTVISSMPSE